MLVSVSLGCYLCSDFINLVVKRLDMWYARERCAMCPSPEPDQKTVLSAPFTVTLFWFAGWDQIHCPGWWANHRIRFGKVIFLVVMMVS